MSTAILIPADDKPRTTLVVLWSLSLCHLINDIIQSLLPALYPVLERNYALSFTEVGLIHFAFMATASLLQPMVGLASDRAPMPRLAALGMGASLIGLVTLGLATSYALLILAAVAVGVGSSIFHPEASRYARAASGGRYGFAQSLFQVGGNTGSAVGPLLAAFVVLPLGQGSVVWFAGLALIGMSVLWLVGSWSRDTVRRAGRKPDAAAAGWPNRRVTVLLALLGVLVFSKYIYLASFTSYYTFYLIERFDLSIAASQIMLFVFLGGAALGTFAGGPIGDRFGRKLVITVSILGTLPFTLALPFANLAVTGILSAIIGLVLASAFSAILVYAQELVPGRVGLVSGLFFGFAFGIGGIGAAALGMLADTIGIVAVYQMIAFLPAAGLVALLLPREDAIAAVRDLRPRRAAI